MASTVGDVLRAVGGFAPEDKAAEWDPVGLQLGDPDATVQRVAVCHEVSESVVAAVEKSPSDLLVTYHPLLLRPTNRLVAGRNPAGRAWRLARAGTAVAVAHTSFDAAAGGTADALAEALGLRSVVPFAPVAGGKQDKIVTFVPEADVDRVADAMVRAGAGRIGNYSHCSFRSTGTGTFFAGSFASPAVGSIERMNRETEVRLEMVVPEGRVAAVTAALLDLHPYEEPAYDIYPRSGNSGAIGRIGTPPGNVDVRAFAHLVAEKLGGTISLAWAGPDLTRVAVVPGSGSSFADEALAAGASLLVTGDVSHHRARRAIDGGLSVIDAGHARTERPGIRRLVEVIEGAGVEVEDLTPFDPTPWEFVD
jgi:dinuclear metal center YbgI/SA1388 family protein